MPTGGCVSSMSASKKAELSSDVVRFSAPGLQVPGHPGHWIGRDGTWWRYFPGNNGKTKKATPYWKRFKPQMRSTRLWIKTNENGVRKWHRLDKLVLSLWKPGSGSIGFVPINFPDPDPRNCHADNLKWGPRNLSRDLSGGAKYLPRTPGATHHNAMFTETQVQEIRDDYRSGLTIGEIAEYQQCSYASIRNVLMGKTYQDVIDPSGPMKLRQDKVRCAFHPRAKLDWEIVGQAKTMRAQGMTWKAIADHFGVTPKAISSAVSGRTWKVRSDS
jgi:uncharacterized protein (DUF433 family)